MHALYSTLGILEKLVSFPTISSRSNLDIVRFIEELLSHFGIVSRRIGDASGSKASILATIGPHDRAGVVLSAHTDVVPTDGQDWTSPPFKATTRGGRIFGRGTSDMKGFLAVVLGEVENFKQSAKETSVHLAFSYDEEVGCRGAPELVAAIAAMPIRPALCIVGEPTGLRAVTGHKGKIARRITIKGRGGHSALPHRAANAVLVAAQLATRLGELGDQQMRFGPRHQAFDPPWSTVHIGSIHGGSVVNLVPDHAVLELEVRVLPDIDLSTQDAAIKIAIAELDAQLKAQAPEGEIRTEIIADYPAFSISADDPAVLAVATLAQSTATEHTVSFGTEAGIYAAAGIPTVVCGPGDITRAHKANEWIGIDEVAAATRMMRRLAGCLDRRPDEWLSRAP
jgi:acetylornithine deacetylase